MEVTIAIRESEVRKQLDERYQALDKCLLASRFKKKLFKEICKDIDRLEAMLRIVEKQKAQQQQTITA